MSSSQSTEAPARVSIESYHGPQHFTLPDESMQKVLVADHVTVDLGGKRILDDVTFWIPKGEFVCLCGPNGAGKSTFLKTVLGVIEPSHGSIQILGKPAGKAGKAVGYVPQRKTFAQDFPASAIELIVANIRGTWPLRISAPEREQARLVLKRVGGEKLIDKPLSGLSGGETQRVFLARALVNNPALIILDEPTAGVDVKGRQEFLDILAEISASDELAAILVTHNPAAVARCAERVVYLEGKLVAWGLPQELLGRNSLSAIAFAAKDHAHALPPDED
jgi:ABC-type Mn2+/Zn2+ transport system ATPase subunit